MPISALRILPVVFLLTAALPLRAQESAPAPASAADLYRRLRSVGLDEKQVYQVRDAGLQRDELHLSFNDGTIAFSHDVDGRITAAFFQGEGHILVIPPSNVERFSLSSFTGSAVLEERFTTAFLRFNDDVLAELKPWLRPAADPAGFVARWDGATRSLSEGDALRLLVSFTKGPEARPSRILRARLGGSRLGTFDVHLDNSFAESFSVGQLSHSERGMFYDLWMAFASRSQREPGQHYQPRRFHDVVQITKVEVDSFVEPPTDLRCTAQVTMKVRNPGDRTLLFELSRYLKLTLVELVGAGSLHFIQNEALGGSELARRGNDLVAIVFPQPLAAGQEMTLRFTYGGPVLSEAGGGLLYVGARGAWYPNRGFAFADYDLRFTYPPGWTLVATGRPQPLSKARGLQVARFVSERPIPVAGFNLGQYVAGEAGTDTVAVRAFATRSMEKEFVEEAQRRAQQEAGRRRLPLYAIPFLPDPASNAQDVARKAAAVMAELSRLFGPYPFSSLALTQMPGTASQGWPALVFLSSYVFLSDSERERARVDAYNNLLYGRLMLPHEIAHQWWGNAMLWETYRDQWIVEALSSYSALLLLEEDDPEAHRFAMDELRADLLREGEAGKPYKDAGPVTLGGRLSSSSFPDGFDVVSYGRGAWLLHMLRHMLRDASASAPPPRAVRGRRAVVAARDPDELFFRVMRDLRRDFDGKSISTADLRQAFEAVLPRALWFEGRQSLDWFFEDWVNGVELPRYELKDVRFTTQGGRRVVTGKILQRDAPDRLVTSVPIYAARADAPLLLGRVFADGEETEFRFHVPAGTKRLLLDPLHTVLRRP